MDIYETYLWVLNEQHQKLKAGKCFDENVLKEATSAAIGLFKENLEVAEYLEKEQFSLAYDSYKLDNIWG